MREWGKRWQWEEVRKKGRSPPPPSRGEKTNKTNFIELLSGDGEESNYEKDYVVTDLKKRDSTKLNARFFKQFISRGQSV